jgi:hypothetical protein
MKTVQKLEVITGAATPIAALIYIYYGIIQVTIDNVIYRRGQFNEGITGLDVGILFSFAIIWFLSLLVAFGAYFHARGSAKAMDILWIGTAGVMILLGAWGFAVLIVQGIFWSMLVYSSVVLSIITVVLADTSEKNASTNPLKLND